MKLTLYQVDAFTDQLFGGNPAAVVPLESWLDDKLMQQLAMENNLSETVFFVKSVLHDHDFDIRWFTPSQEIDLCGHATLASAYVLFEKLGYTGEKIRFHSKSGTLQVTRDQDRIKMDFPSWKPLPATEIPAALLHSLNVGIVQGVYKHRDWLVELDNEAAVKNCEPDFTRMKKMGGKVIITAKGDESDFVSRFFAPDAGVDEDPVTGSAHSQLIPFWSEKLNKTSMHARQLSPRGGEIWCEFLGDRVTISGCCVFYMKGEFETIH